MCWKDITLKYSRDSWHRWRNVSLNVFISWESVCLLVGFKLFSFQYLSTHRCLNIWILILVAIELLILNAVLPVKKLILLSHCCYILFWLWGHIEVVYGLFFKFRSKSCEWYLCVQIIWTDWNEFMIIIFFQMIWPKERGQHSFRLKNWK